MGEEECGCGSAPTTTTRSGRCTTTGHCDQRLSTPLPCRSRRAAASAEAECGCGRSHETETSCGRWRRPHRAFYFVSVVCLSGICPEKKVATAIREQSGCGAGRATTTKRGWWRPFDLRHAVAKKEVRFFFAVLLDGRASQRTLARSVQWSL